MNCPKCRKAVAEPVDVEGGGMLDGKPAVHGFWECENCGAEWETLEVFRPENDDQARYAQLQSEEDELRKKKTSKNKTWSKPGLFLCMACRV